MAFALTLVSANVLAQDKPAPDLPEVPADPAVLPDKDDIDPADPVDPKAPDLAPAEKDKGPKVIAIVYDGKSPYFEERIADWKTELTALAAGKYLLEYRELDSGFDPAKVTDNLSTTLKDAEVDLVYAAGIMASEQAAKLDIEDRPKPVMSGALRFSDARNLPISKNGTSTIPNYSFITEPQRASADLSLLKRLAGSGKITVLVDAPVLTMIKELGDVKASLEKQTGTTTTLRVAGKSAAEALASIPPGTRGVYVTLLSRMGKTERRKLYSGLASRGLPNVSMLGRPEVDLGAMAALRGDVGKTVARRSALNIHLLLQGTSADALTVYLPVADRFVLNAAAAKRAGWAPDPDTLLTAEWTEDAIGKQGKTTDLDKAMRDAMKQNIEVLTAREGETIADQDVNIARSFLRPQITARAEHGITGIQDPINDRLTGNWTHAGRYGLELRQVLFSDELKTQVEATNVASLATRYETRSQQLDAAGDTAQAYFGILSALALVKIEQENLRLSLNNLELAKLRSDIGAAAPNEINRWQQEQFRARAQLLQRHSDYLSALVQFNRVAGYPRESRWTLENITLGEHDYYFMDNSLKRVAVNTREFRRFAFYLMFLAVENSPELDGFDRVIAAQGIVLAQKKRAFYLPDVALVASADRIVNGTEATDTDADTEGFLGINISLPLTTGGFRTADVARQSALIRQTTYRREEALQRIEQGILKSLNEMGFSHPNIRLTREALKAAEAHYASSEELYSEGAATLVDLLEAQTTLIRQKQETELSVYIYLSDVFSMQRSIAWFQFEQSEQDRARFDRNLRHFLSGGRITTANGHLLQTGFEINSIPLDKTWAPPKAKVLVEPRKRPTRSGSKLFRKR